MSKLDINFSDYKASGVYFIEKDNSIIEDVQTQSARIAVGFSKKGPFNAPVYIDNTSDLAEVFGDIDTKLERKGVFFNRSLQTLIGVAPTYALNLLPFTETGADAVVNQVGVLEMGTTLNNTNQDVTTALYQDLHDTSRFWKPSAEHMNEKFSESPINFANVGTSDFTLIIRKAEGLNGFNVTVRDWYGTDANIPYAWMKPGDLISDYFIQVICLDGDWSDKKLGIDPFWKEYFTTDGNISYLKRDKVSKFLKLDQVTVIGNYTGTIIPEFYDKSGLLRSIQELINGYTLKTGLLCAVNEELLEEGGESFIDFVGHNAGTGISCDMMSYNFKYGDLSHDLGNGVSLKDNIISFANDSSIVEELTVGSMIGMIGEGNSVNGNTRITKKRIYGMDSSVFCEISVYDGSELGTDGPLSGSIAIIPAIQDCYTELAPICLSGLDIDKKIENLFSVSKGEEWINDGYTYMGEDVPIAKIYSVLTDKGVRRGLLNRGAIDFRYIIDTMGHGLGEECGSKKFLSKLAMDHERTLAFISGPSMTEFAKCPLAAFYDENDPFKTFDVKYIPQGGNDNLIKQVEFSMISEENGAKYCGIFGPYVKYRSGSKEILVPPAAEVANAYMAKYLGGDPYVTIANVNGVLSGGRIRGLEYDFDDTDRGYLEPFGFNPIIKDGNRIKIYGDRTAFQNYITDYNYLHVREILNTIEIECDAILKNYVFRYNNAQIRSEIYKKINPILDAMKQSGALYKYELEMDENNNTKEVIDRSFAIIDLGVWITKNMEKVIARITVNKLSDND